ncbi:SPOR domain-containing protein [Undibacterium sp. Di27W]|uniref:SPOR domain-containing protein n=1 Tax=Undibacterium sp. Di27W TaxID=3413036 RepID=UPI003BF13126
MGLLSRFTQKQETSDTQDSGEFRSRAEEESIETRARTKKAEPRRRSKVDDPILPEKKRARRRLIGAVALALAAIIGLPMILDSDPKPLADDINIRIPSKDKVGDVADAVPPKTKSQLPVEPPEEIIEVPSSPKNKVAANENTDRQVKTATTAANAIAPLPPAAQLKPEAKTETKPAVKPEAKPEPKVEVKPVQTPSKPVEKEVVTAKNETKVDTKPETKPAETKPAKTEAKPVVAKPGNSEDEAARALAILEGKSPPAAKPVVSKPEAAEKSSYTVQAGAFSTQSKVDEVQAKLNAASIHSYTQKIITTNGEVTRIRVGPFASKEEAEKMRAKLSKLGLSASLPPN